MWADLNALAKVLRPISDKEARELVRRAEEEAGAWPPGFVAAEEGGHDEYWETARRIEGRGHGEQTTRRSGEED
jgi:hypothetical protein